MGRGVIDFDFDIVGGAFDGAPGMFWVDDGQHPPPDLIFVGVCAKGSHCGTAACRRHAKHVSYWLPEEDTRPPRAQPYEKQSEHVERSENEGELTGRAVYVVGGLLDPANFGEAARELPREPTAAGVSPRTDPVHAGFHPRVFDEAGR